MYLCTPFTVHNVSGQDIFVDWFNFFSYTFPTLSSSLLVSQNSEDSGDLKIVWPNQLVEMEGDQILVNVLLVDLGNKLPLFQSYHCLLYTLLISVPFFKIKMLY